MARHGERRAAEMEEVAATLRELGVEPLMALATVKRQREMGQLGMQMCIRDSNNNLVGVRVLYEVIDSPPGESNDDDRPPLKLASARLEFNDVRFAYRPGTPVLRGMSFVAQPGKVTALVGPSGGGKSTVLDLILRFYTVGSGRILIDGQDIATVSRDSLRQQIAYVGPVSYTHLCMPARPPPLFARHRPGRGLRRRQGGARA